MELERSPIVGALVDSESVSDLLDAMPDGVIVVAVGGTISFANVQISAQTGYARRELYGMSVEALVPELQRAGHRRHRDDYNVHPEARTMGAALDIRVRRKDGSEFPADVSLSPIWRGGELATVASVRDATEQREVRRRSEHLAILEERERILRALHQESIHQLFALGLALQALAGRPASHEVRSELESAVQQADGIIEGLRSLIFQRAWPA